MELNASQIRKLILDEHAVLRDELEDISALLRDVAAERAQVAERLQRRMKKFYEAFLKHIAHEDSLLRPVLANIDAWGAVRVDKLDEEHREQRSVIGALTSLEAASNLENYLARTQGFVDSVMADMAAEEHECLSPDILRDDTIVIDYFTG
jgi:iron-sulfur cluster repair protein YtfE (RIC family)